MACERSIHVARLTIIRVVALKAGAHLLKISHRGNLCCDEDFVSHPMHRSHHEACLESMQVVSPSAGLGIKIDEAMKSLDMSEPESNPSIKIDDLDKISPYLADHDDCNLTSYLQANRHRANILASSGLFLQTPLEVRPLCLGYRVLSAHRDQISGEPCELLILPPQSSRRWRHLPPEMP